MHKISTQLEFITKYIFVDYRTTQILEARVINNGEQLHRLIGLYQSSSSEQEIESEA